MLSRLRTYVRKRVRHSQGLARLWRLAMFRTTVIAITGSVGKTTTRALLVEMLKKHARVHHTFNNENDMWSLPGTILRMRPWHRYSVLELSAAGPGTLKALAEIARPDIAIVTAVAGTHTKEYESIDDIAQEKSELVRHLRKNGIAVLNADNPYTAAMAQLCQRPPLTFGVSANTDVRAHHVTAPWPARLSMEIETRGQLPEHSFPLASQLVGEHWTNSILAAVTAALWCQSPIEDITSCISDMPPFRARMQPIQLPSGAVAIQDNNASDVVFKAMLDVARQAQAQRKILILGDLNDIDGLSRSRDRRRYSGQTAAPFFDVLVFVGSGSRHAAKAALNTGKDPEQVLSFETSAPVADWLAKISQPGDLVFVKGQNIAHLRKIVLRQFGELGCELDTCPIRSDCDVCKDLKPQFDLSDALAWR